MSYFCDVYLQGMWEKLSDGPNWQPLLCVRTCLVKPASVYPGTHVWDYTSLGFSPKAIVLELDISTQTRPRQ